MTARRPLQAVQAAPLREARPETKRPAFHMPANDNGRRWNWRVVAWGLTLLGFAAAIAVLVRAGF